VFRFIREAPADERTTEIVLIRSIEHDAGLNDPCTGSGGEGSVKDFCEPKESGLGTIPDFTMKPPARPIIFNDPSGTLK